ncbi:hypothetical protein [Blastococcus tunisiensis]|uniref:Uncharacterized protein n=1 Tax=Blastococcus tunisiensis TaxID=1798228 RepID=A0A1I2LRS0_9ACTN|nr:hypothetical protein [Blastococcus sp. DSM 46838]SFF81813.1 hypothetical protein SAMN05216574_12818 [Blastococcus sp. DSM 46838]
MRPAARAAVLLAALLALLAVLAGPAAARSDSGTGEDRAADSVVVVGVPGLTWADIDPVGTPELWALAQESSIGALSVRAARGTTCVLDGWATLGAGNRTRVPGPDDGLPPVPLPTVPLTGDEAAPATPVPGADGEPAPEPQLYTSLSYCGLQERTASVALEDPLATVERTAADPGTRRFGAEPAALGEQVGCATVSGRAATLAVAAPGVELTRPASLPSDPGQLAEVLGQCPLTLVSLDQLTAAGRPGVEKTDDGTDPEPRASALARIDRAVGELRAAIAPRSEETLLLLAGISEVNDGRPQLHVGMASGPGFGSGWLTSSSTGRAPYVQLIDVAPTALRALGLERPPSMNGQPMRSVGERPALETAVELLREANTAATVHHRNVGNFFWVVVFVSALVVALGIVLLGGWQRRPAPRSPGPRARALLRLLALVAGALPVATYLAGLVPWERSGSPLPALVLAVVAADLAVVALALAGPWRRARLGPALVVVAVTLLTLLLDVLTGSSLELNGLLGYDAIVAGRFTGYGNLSFGLLAVSALLVTAAVAAAAGRRAGPGRARAVTAATVLGIGLVTVAVIGAPSLGRDFGGVLSAMPGFLLLAMLLARVRVTLARFAAILVVAALAVGTVAVLDWTGPPDERSHLGRFVEQVLTGEAWTVVSRKASANIDILLGSPLAWMLPVALVAAVWLLRPGGLLRGGAGLPAGDAAVLRAGLVAGALSLALGAAVNDSGVALPATAAALLVPLLVWLAAGRGGTGTPSEESAGGAPHSGPVEGPDRVTVVSRGSTVGNP